MSKFILFLGPPGSGKGTQAQKLSANYGYIQISTGDLLREAVRNETEIGLTVKKVIERGDLVSDNVIIDIMKEKLLGENLEDSCFILDGFPRTVGQAEQLKNMLITLNLNLDCIFNFKLTVEDVVERISNRLICKACNKIYKKTEITSTICECEQKGELIERKDDNAEKALHRYEQYIELTKPLEEYYSDLVTEVDASQTEETVYRFLCETIEKKNYKFICN